MNPQYSGRNALFTLIAIPTVAVIGVRLMLPVSNGPRTAQAAGGVHVEEPTEFPPARRLTQGQADLLTHADAVLASGFARSPLQQDAPAAKSEEPAPAPATPDQEEVKAPSLVLTSIMSSAEGPVAVINGKVGRTGSAVAPGWKIEAILPNEGRVVILHVSGKAHTIQLRTRRGG